MNPHIAPEREPDRNIVITKSIIAALSAPFFRELSTMNRMQRMPLNNAIS
jgi:hypothetical protein